MKLKKTNAVLGLASTAAMAAHIGYTVFAYLAFYYNPALKLWTAVPFMVLACLHAVCGMTSVFLQADGTRLDLYPKRNLRTILQRVSAALILPLLILHINTFGLLQSTTQAGQWLWFGLLMLGQPLFYAVALIHVATSVSRALITLGWLSSRDRQQTIDRAVYALCAAAFANDCYLVASRNRDRAGEIREIYAEHFGRDCSKSLSCMEVCPMKIPTLASMARLNRLKR